MSTPTSDARPAAAPLYVPSGWTARAAPPRDVALDLVRGLAMVILVVNHLPLKSPLEDATSAVVSAAEVLVLVSGIVAGMVFGRRWRERGGRATTALLLRRARKLYLASLCVVALVGLLTLVPGAATEALTRTRGIDTYAYDGPLEALRAWLTLAAGPWQFNILGFFVTVIALTPLVLAALARGWTVPVAALSLAAYAAARTWDLRVLPSLSEQPFPVLVWQVLFVGGLLAGWHRESLERLLAGRGRRAGAGAVLAAMAAAALILWGPGGDAAWAQRHLDKDTLDPARLLVMAALAGGLYVVLHGAPGVLRWFLLPLGRSSFYVFIVQVFLCLAVASTPLPDGGMAIVAALALQLLTLGALWIMVTRRVLFHWIPR